jgi:radical SAM superfamily enzyme YgiQ (UPF0313 family)
VSDSRKYAGERNLESYPRPRSGSPLVIAAYPNRYRVGMSNLGFHFIYSSLARSGRFRVERLFLDDFPSPVETDAVFFTVSYEEDLLNLVKMLISLGIEPMRVRRESGPLVIAGGPVVSSNPLPFFPLADVLAAGEGEEVLAMLIDSADAGWDDAASLAERFSGTDGLLFPGFKEKTVPAGPVDPSLFQHSTIITPETVFPDMLLVEISRGCPGACAFCMATSVYRPFRTLPIDRFEAILDSAAGTLGTLPGKVGLVSTAAAAHPRFTGMIEAIMSRGGRAGLSSLRAADIDAGSAEEIGRAGIRSVTLAPESGSERMRMKLGKKAPDRSYLDAARLLRGSGVSRFTLYMLAGLPGEDSGSASETEMFLGAFADAAKGARVSVNLNVLVPKPRTPLQFMPMQEKRDIRASIESMRSVCRSSGVALSVKGERASLNQARIALGDESVGRAAVRLAVGSTSWKRALRDEGIDPDFIHAERGLEGLLPWEYVLGDDGRDALLGRYRATVS